jgi:hypothetical protein
MVCMRVNQCKCAREADTKKHIRLWPDPNKSRQTLLVFEISQAARDALNIWYNTMKFYITCAILFHIV